MILNIILYTVRLLLVILVAFFSLYRIIRSNCINSSRKVGLGTTGSDYMLSIREADNNNKWLMLKKIVATTITDKEDGIIM